MVSPSRILKYRSSIPTVPARTEKEKLIELYEVDPSRNPFLCTPDNLPRFNEEYYDDKSLLKIPAWSGFEREGRSDYKYDAYPRHVWSIQECEQARRKLHISEEQWKKADQKFTDIFFGGVNFVERVKGISKHSMMTC